MKNKDNYILTLQTFPASKLEGMSFGGLKQYRKELIKIGKYTHPSAGYDFEVTLDTLNHWVATFSRWYANGNKVPIPLDHDSEHAEANQGWVTNLFVEGNSLYGILELVDPKLSLTTDVSLRIEDERTDSKGVKYTNVITHVALCTDPVIIGLDKFKVLSLSIGETSMEFVKRIAKALGMSGDTPTEESVVTEAEKVNQKKVEKVELSQSSNSEYVVKMLSENREIKLSNLLKAGMITPAVKDVITAKYVEVGELTLSMSTKADDGFDLLYDVLAMNHPIKLDEVTGVQSLELANQSVEQPNAMQKDINRRRKEAGLNS